MRTPALSRFILLVTLMLVSTFGIAGTDLHRLWDSRCAECHGHSAEFSRQFLQIKEGQLQGQHHIQNLMLFMRNHYAPADEVDAIYDMLLAQARSAPRFRDECGACHGNAADFVRTRITPQNGELFIRGSGLSVLEFMQTHRGLQQDDIDFFVNLLNRLAIEVNHP
jgi:hypothetical protein